jgi:tetratricopeptide (TPR) repeat protein
VLLDRRKVKFWQKWVFGIMALLMAGFLVMIPLNNGIGCGGETTATDQLQADIDRYEAAVKADRKDVNAWRSLGDAYVRSVSSSHQQGTALTEEQTAKLERATVAYRKAVRLLAERKGAEAKTQRLDTLEMLTSVYDTLGDFQSEVATYGELTELKPRNADYFFGMGNAAINAGDTTSAVLALQRFLELSPNDPASSDVKAWIKQNTEGTGQ